MHSALKRFACSTDVWLMAIVILTIAVVNYAWLTGNTVPSEWDEANHLHSALLYHRGLIDCLRREVALRRCIGQLVYVDQYVYPPLAPAAAGLLSIVTGTSRRAVVMTNIVYLPFLYGALLYLGGRLHSRAAGRLSAVLLILYPMVFINSRQFMLEIGTLTVTAASVAVLMHSEAFRTRGRSAVFGVTVGLGLLTKPVVVTYLIGPVVAAAGMVLWAAHRGELSRRDLGRRAANAGVAGLIAAGVASVWYVPNRHYIFPAMQLVASMDTAGVPVTSLASWSIYPRWLSTEQVGVAFALLFALAMVRLWRVATLRTGIWLTLWVLSIYVIHTLVRHKIGHQTIGALIPIALISAIALVTLSRIRMMAITTVIVFGVLQGAALSLPPSTLRWTPRPEHFGWEANRAHVSRDEPWPITQAIRALGTGRPRVMVASDHRFINGSTLGYYAADARSNVAIVTCHNLIDRPLDQLLAYDFVVAKSDSAWVPEGPRGPRCYTARSGYEAVLRYLEEHRRDFTVVRRDPLPDGTALLIYQRAPDGG